MKWNQPADAVTLEKTIKALKSNNIEAYVVSSSTQAKKKVLELVPKGAEVMVMSSQTLETVGLTKELNESGDYDAVKTKLMAMDRNTQGRQMQKLGAAPDWAVGSVQAITRDGHVLMASNTGSQLSAYVYGAGHVVWVVGTQKIVASTDEGIRRIYEYVLPLEDARMRKAYNMGSAVGKLLIFNSEKIPGRVTVIFVKEPVGF